MRILLAPSLLASLLLLSTAQAQFQFDPGVNLPASQRPSDVAAGDFDGDGDRDLAVTVDNPDSIQIFHNDGAGNFTLGATVILPVSSSPGDIETGDLDGDTDMDLAVALQDFSSVQTVLNNGGVFTLGSSFSVGANPRGLAMADHDGDGDLDLSTANRDSNTGTVLTNAGNATFTGQTLAAGLEPRGSAFGDFDGDGDKDLAVTGHDSRTVSVYTNTGGSFALSTTLNTNPQTRPEGIASADLNGDGFEDLAVANNGNAFEFASVFLASTGGFAFSGPFDYASGGLDTGQILAADFDCDGDMDLATANAGSNNVSLLANQGGGSFGAAMQLGAGTEPDNFTAADLDGDGDPDIAVANKLSNNVTFLRNQTCSGGPLMTLTGTCPGPVTANVSGATPGGQVGLLYAIGTGSFVIPAGNPCAGTTLGLDASAVLGAIVTANASGSVSAGFQAPAIACGRVFGQAVDGATCTTSNVVSL